MASPGLVVGQVREGEAWSPCHNLNSAYWAPGVSPIKFGGLAISRVARFLASATAFLYIAGQDSWWLSCMQPLSDDSAEYLGAQT